MIRPFHIAMCALAATSPLEGAASGAIYIERAARERARLLQKSHRTGRDVAALDRMARKNRRKRR